MKEEKKKKKKKRKNSNFEMKYLGHILCSEEKLFLLHFLAKVSNFIKYDNRNLRNVK